MAGLRLFGLSFLILFLELALIRWIPAYIRLVGYFSNLILIAAFLGLGLGILWTKMRLRLFYFFPVSLVTVLTVVLISRLEVNIANSEVIFFKALEQKPLTVVEPEFILPLIFILVTLLFTTIGQEFGRVFGQFKPLPAYTIDIIGSLVGIGLFSLTSAMAAPAWMWFLIIGISASLLIMSSRRLIALAGISLLSLTIVLTWFVGKNSYWSPYYRITLTPFPGGYGISANNIGHQAITDWKNGEPFYLVPYEAFTSHAYKKILIIGAGSGNDIAVALAKQPELIRIDAVEIDPILVRLGKRLHPNRPYQDPRVHVYITDGRNFLSRSREQYDLIIYALTDSLTLTAQTSNLRLESFLFTKESLALARQRLSPNGLLTLYNYYRERWLVDKIAGIAQASFGQSPYVWLSNYEGNAAVLLVGGKTRELTSVQPAYHPDQRLRLPTDDWPFLYLKNQTIPVFYLKFLLIILTITLLLVIPTIAKGGKPQFNWRFFLFGVAFLLLETKSLVTFGLLFGTTWVVNGLVFAAILTSVLLANLISLKLTIKALWRVYLLLFGALVASLLIPSAWFNYLPISTRYLLASAFYFAPIFLANLIFSQLFKTSQDAPAALGANIIGAVLGGILEYSAMAVGYRWLILVIIACYALALTPTKLQSYATK